MSTTTSKARLLATCSCCRRHAMAPTHHISRPCEQPLLFVLVRASLDEVVNTELSAGGAFDSSMKRAIFFFTFGEQKLRISDRYKQRAHFRSVEKMRSLFPWNIKYYVSAAPWAPNWKLCFWRARAIIFHVPKKRPTQNSIVRSFH